MVIFYIVLFIDLLSHQGKIIYFKYLIKLKLFKSLVAQDTELLCMTNF